MKLLDTKIGTDWTTLNELITVQPGDKVALYNADVIAYNYWLSIPGYRLAMRLIGYKKKKVIS